MISYLVSFATNEGGTGDTVIDISEPITSKDIPKIRALIIADQSAPKIPNYIVVITNIFQLAEDRPDV